MWPGPFCVCVSTIPTLLRFVLYCFILSVSYIFYVFLDIMFILAFELTKMDLSVGNLSNFIFPSALWSFTYFFRYGLVSLLHFIVP